MTTRAHIAPMTDMLNRRLKVYLTDDGYGVTSQRVRSFESERMVFVDGAQILPDEIKPLELTWAEAEALFEALRERLGKQLSNEDFWQKRFEEERKLTGALAAAFGKLCREVQPMPGDVRS